MSTVNSSPRGVVVALVLVVVRVVTLVVSLLCEGPAPLVLVSAVSIAVVEISVVVVRFSFIPPTPFQRIKHLQLLITLKHKYIQDLNNLDEF